MTYCLQLTSVYRGVCKSSTKMRFKQTHPQPIKSKYRLYSPSSITAAYRSVKEDGMSVLRAARTYRVPETTLRDRVLAKVDAETCVMGSLPLFDQFREAKIVEHFKTMADLGYGYTQQECVDVATQYAIQLGLRSKDKPLSMSWMRGFLSRWPEMRVSKPRALEYVRAKMANESVVNAYFNNLEQCLRKNDLLDKPHLMYNVDEKGVSIEHRPPFVVAGSDHPVQAVTAGRGKTITILGGGSASGSSVPPFFVFPGKRMNKELLKGSSPGADGTVSESGWSNLEVFHRYLTEHFIKFVPARNDHPLILFLDGHKSHVSLTLADWAKKNNIIMFILPAHTSHLCQPLDVSCYGPFQRMYHCQCHKYTRQTSATITRYNICELSCKVYTKALSADNLQSGFMRTGIYPVDRNAIPKSSLIPAEVFESESEVEVCSQTTESTVEGGVLVDDEDRLDVFEVIEKELRSVKKEKSVKKSRNTVSKHVSGKELTSNSVMEAVKQHEISQATKKCVSKSSGKKTPLAKKKPASPVPGPSHINLAVDTDSDTDMDSQNSHDDANNCCVCGRFRPKEMDGMVSLVFTKWAQCDGKRNGQPCLHWTHLKYCTPVRVIRRGVDFFCPHCSECEE